MSDERRAGQVFRMQDGSLVKLDRRVLNADKKWYVADWCPWKGWDYGSSSIIDSDDLMERVPESACPESMNQKRSRLS